MTMRLDQLKACYRVLGARLNAPPEELKRVYRSLVKQWHPDRYPARSVEQKRASLRMRQINTAYREVRNAPLRYFDPVAPKVEPVIPPSVMRSWRQSSSSFDTLITGMRFFMGAFFGAAFGLMMMFRAVPAPWLYGPILAGAAGYLAVRLDDDVWEILTTPFWKA